MAAIRFSVFLAALALAGCGGPAENKAAVPVAAVAACEPRTFEGTAFTACRYDRRRDEIALFLDGPHGPLRSFAALDQQLGQRVQRLRFSMNAGMYDEAGNPIGLFVEAGHQGHAINRQRGPGNFHMLPNGVFTVAPDGRVAVGPPSVTTRPRGPAGRPSPVRCW
jgi:uncharacterized protein YigE (DUF2233 family)